MTIRNPIDWEGLRRSGALVAETIALLKEKARPGMTTEELDWEAEEHLRRHGARPAPALCYNFPGTACISVNNEAAHGVPSSRVLKEGDLVNVDVSLELGGYFADSGASFGLGPISGQQKKLLEAAQLALDAGLSAVTAGAPIRAIADIYAEVADSRGFGLIRDLTGHGVGGWIHEEPKHVPDFGRRKDGHVLTWGDLRQVDLLHAPAFVAKDSLRRLAVGRHVSEQLHGIWIARFDASWSMLDAIDHRL